MVSRRTNVVHVRLNEPYMGKRDWYFSSIAAIYERLPKEVVGAGKEWLWQCLADREEYSTRKATVRKSEVYAKPHSP